MRFASPQSSKVLLSTFVEFHNQDLCEEFFGSRQPLLRATHFGTGRASKENRCGREVARSL